MNRTIFMISDGTGITAENFGNSLMSQFSHATFDKEIFPYIDTIEKANQVVLAINASNAHTGIKPIAFITLINPDIVDIIKNSNCIIYDLFGTYLLSLEDVLGVKSTKSVGQTHGVSNIQTYSQRMEAIEYTMGHDDGVKMDGYKKADIILMGVSRSGKTPSCLYLALHYGVLAANYPITEEDLLVHRLPTALFPHKKKLFGLTIDCERLQQIRNARRPDSLYASYDQCRREIGELEALYQREKIPFLNSTHYSIEEIATKVMSISELKRKF